MLALPRVCILFCPEGPEEIFVEDEAAEEVIAESPAFF